MPLCKDIIKRRVIRFKDNDPSITARASELLSAVQGVSKARQLRPGTISIHYDIRVLSLQMIEQALDDVGFDLNQSVFCRIKRGLIAYCEDTLREELRAENTEAAATKSSDSGHHAHDPRPYNWRNFS